MRQREILLRLIIALTVATFIVTSVAGVERNNSREASTELEHAVSGVTTETGASDDTEYEDEEDEGEEEDEENEEDVDEYEEELREVAESHEAMSRDERGNETSGVNNSEVSVAHNDAKATRNFDSHEKSVEEGSDESMTSNEAISDEAEREKAAEYKRDVDSKSKRVPTVKKELSTQKEIQSNETSDVEATEIIGRLEERSAGYSPGRTREIIDNDLMDRGSSSYVETESRSRRIDKRQKVDPKSLLRALLPDLVLELKRRRNLQDIETEDWAQAESLMKLLVRLAENPGWWERAHRLLKDVREDDLELSSPLDSRKRGYAMDIFGSFTTPSPTNPSNQKPTPKKPKKKKKKKKKPKHQPSTTTLSPPTLTTQKPSEKPETHWRLVAERLFGPGWSANRKESKDFSKLGYIPLNSQTPSPNYREKYVNDAGPRDYTRKFHFGKVNTHEKGSPINQNDANTNYDINTSSGSRVLDYDIPERNYERPRVTDRYDRYNHYMDRIREFGDDSGEDYGDAYPDVEYPRHRGFYGKSWRYSRYETPKSTDSYYDNNRKNFGRYRPWTVFRPVIEIDEDDITVPRFYNKFEGQWPVERNVDAPWELISEPRSKIFGNSPSLPVNKNREINETAKTKTTKELGGQKSGMKFRSGLNLKPASKDVVIPKLTMKTWNSLTSDPATWPFKLSGAKPWPKDKNGKTYNPNAELVRKLGLDKQSQMLERGGEKDTKDQKDSEEMRKATSLPQRDDSGVWKDDRKIWPWQGKLTDWNVDFGKQEQSSTWTPKWKQFSYHKVNAGPVAKPGSNLDGAKARNSFIAMSAVTPSRFPGNEWRKNDIEENIYHTEGNIDRDDPAGQMLARHNDPVGHWMKSTNFKRAERNRTTDVLENQLENLRGKNVNNGINSTQPTYLQSTVSQPTISTISSTKSTSINLENNEVDKKFNNTVK